ncbi:EH signature domain-containing protein [Hyphomicrobium sp. LHD-15]|uniref:EH signature domain-containing protein n=1 Tax=Hyphomicrobium sp. LHD-15 TaxID=3072142 RepID=UPI00280FE46C|nr:EH signature domain-containing protein [Hyphomicrobium sp. LHD-15]MDQ8698161.1 EH signature domain-containing protein [Hyphomicrobium sp. LHD-15]
MMSPISALTSSLAKINHELLAAWASPTAEGMAKATEAIARRFGSSSRRSSSLSGDRMIEAIRRVRDQNGDVDFRTLRRACYGVTLHLASDDYLILGDHACLNMLLAAVSSHCQQPRRFRRLYEGLLTSYLTAERTGRWFGTQLVRAGNDQLRKFLQENVDLIQSIEPSPEWVGALADYAGVLGADPGDRFGAAWIAGDKAPFQDAMQRLRLPGTSWLAGETIRSALEIALSLDHQAFATHIPAFLEAAVEPRFQHLRDDIYVDLIKRYAAIPSPPVHAPLRDALVSAWKNPWLDRNDPAWSRAGAARSMVAGWLKLDLIHQFFEVLSEDGRQDKSRFEFWRKYHDRMDDVYFALGSRTYWSTNPDIEKLRRSMDGRLLNFTGSESSNNAFIMCMGDIVVVEFSKKGNAAYRYRRSDLPLQDAKQAISVSRLKREPPGKQMRHAGNNGYSWQELFARVLGDQRAAFSAKPQTGVALPDITDFAFANAIALEDHRSKGGNLWLRIDDADPDIVRQLSQWGFNYRAGRGWWR